MRNPIKLGILALVTSATLAAPLPAQTRGGGRSPRGDMPASPSSVTSLTFQGGTLKQFLDVFRRQAAMLGWPSFGVTTNQGDAVLPAFDLLLTRDPNAPQPDTLLSIEFPGGTVADFVASLRTVAKESGSPINVVVPKEAEVIDVPRLSLQSVRAETALKAFASAYPEKSNYRFEIYNFPRNEGEAPSFAIQFEDFSTQSPMMMTPNGPVPAMRSPHSARVQTEVFSVREIIEPQAGKAASASLSREDLLRAIDSAFSLEGKKTERPEVLFHAESGLLIVRGDGDQVDLVKSLLSRVGDDLARRREAAMKAEAERVQIKRLKAQAQNKIQTLQANLDSLKQQFDRAQVRKDAGLDPPDEIAALQRSFINTEMELKNAMLDLESFEALEAEAATPAPADDALNVVQYPLKHISASDEKFLDQIRKVVGENGKITTNTQNNAVIVQATKENQSRVASRIGQLDRETTQKK